MIYLQFLKTFNGATSICFVDLKSKNEKKIPLTRQDNNGNNNNNNNNNNNSNNNNVNILMLIMLIKITFSRNNTK